MEALQGVTVEGMKYTYDQADRLTLRENLITGDYYEYAYDSRGNITGDGIRGYEYDSRNRLVWVSDEKDRPTEITYDSMGRRTKVDFNGEVTKYQYLGDSDKVAKEIRPDGTEISFTYNNEGQPLTMTVNGNTYYYVSNGRGDVIALTDANGAKVASYRYDSWGRELKTVDNETESDQAGISKGGSEIGELNPYRYAGYRYDSKLKLYFLKTRYYDPQLGRFLSRDTYKGDDIEKVAVAQNKYVYVNNNPINMTDQNGQKAVGKSSPKPSKPKAKSPSKPKPKSTPSKKHDTKKAISQKKQTNQKKKPSEKIKKPGNKPTNKKSTNNNKSKNNKKPNATKNLNASKKGLAIKKPVNQSNITENVKQATGKATPMKASEKLVDFIISYESFSATPYRGADSQNLTIGYGHVIKPGEKFTKITKQQARDLLKKDMQSKVSAVNNSLGDTKVNQQQFDALVDLAFNIGAGAFARSTLLKDIKSGKTSDTKIKADFEAWSNCNGKRLLGLWRRRVDEWEIWKKGDYKRDYPKMP